jgi:hypothetical protein
VWRETTAGGDEIMHVGGAARNLRDFGYPIHISELSAATATDLRHALNFGGPYGDRLIVSDGSLDYIDEDDVVFSGVEFGVDDAGELIVHIDVALNDYIDDDNELATTMTRLLGDLLRRHRGELDSVSYHDGSLVGEGPYPAYIEIRPATRGRKLDELYQFGVDVAALLDAASGGDLNRAATLDVLRAGHGAVLLGQPEGAWLDVKKQLYDLSTTAGKISLALAAARFANTEGGIVVFGMATKRVGSGETITKIHPIPTDAHTVRRHRQALETHIYPLPAGLEVMIVPVLGGDLLVVHVPPQPDASKPFLVNGAVVDGKVEGAFIGIVRRHGEDSIPITAPAVHAAMSMNRLVDQLRESDRGARDARARRSPGRVPPKSRR